MNINNFQTVLVDVVEYSDFSTVGELKQILSKYSDNINFGFRNQPFQNLHYIKYKDNSSECLCFQENTDGISIEEMQSVLNTLVSFDENPLKKEQYEDFKNEIDYKSKYEKCINVIRRFDAGIIGMYDL